MNNDELMKRILDLESKLPKKTDSPKGKRQTPFKEREQVFVIHNGKLRDGVVGEIHGSWVAVTIDGASVNFKPSTVAKKDAIEVVGKPSELSVKATAALASAAALRLAPEATTEVVET